MIETVHKELDELVIDHERYRRNNTLYNWGEDYPLPVQTIHARRWERLTGDKKGNINWPFDTYNNETRLPKLDSVGRFGRCTPFYGKPSTRILLTHVHTFSRDRGMDSSIYALGVLNAYPSDGINKMIQSDNHNPRQIRMILQVNGPRYQRWVRTMRGCIRRLLWSYG